MSSSEDTKEEKSAIASVDLKETENDKELEDDLAAALESKLKVTTDDVKESATTTTTTTEKDDDNEDKAPATLKRVAEWIKHDDVQHILVLTGAGVSVAAGIPDFRTPGTGLYDNLRKYNLPYAEAVFDIHYYQQNPHPFVQLASELWPSLSESAPKPTLTHSFVALLSDKGMLLRNYSQVRMGSRFYIERGFGVCVACGRTRCSVIRLCRAGDAVPAVFDRLLRFSGVSSLHVFLLFLRIVDI